MINKKCDCLYCRKREELERKYVVEHAVKEITDDIIRYSEYRKAMIALRERFEITSEDVANIEQLTDMVDVLDSATIFDMIDAMQEAGLDVKDILQTLFFEAIDEMEEEGELDLAFDIEGGHEDNEEEDDELSFDEIAKALAALTGRGKKITLWTSEGLVTLSDKDEKLTMEDVLKILS